LDWNIQEKKFYEYINNPTIELRNELAMTNSRFVRQVANLYAKFHDVDKNDVFNYGMIGVMEAIDNYNVTKGCKFLSYANYHIKKSILRGIKELKGNVKVNINYHFESTKKIIETDNESKIIEEPSTKISIGSFIAISNLFLSSIGITILPNSSTFLTIPVAFIIPPMQNNK